MDRAGKTYRSKKFNALILVVQSDRMSAGTFRHTAIVLDASQAILTFRQHVKEGVQLSLDEVPIAPWDSDYEEL